MGLKAERASQAEGAVPWEVRTGSNLRDYLIDLFFYRRKLRSSHLVAESDLEPFSSLLSVTPFLSSWACGFSYSRRAQLRRVEADPKLELGC